MNILFIKNLRYGLKYEEIDFSREQDYLLKDIVKIGIRNNISNIVFIANTFNNIDSVKFNKFNTFQNQLKENNINLSIIEKQCVEVYEDERSKITISFMKEDEQADYYIDTSRDTKNITLDDVTNYSFNQNETSVTILKYNPDERQFDIEKIIIEPKTKFVEYTGDLTTLLSESFKKDHGRYDIYRFTITNKLVKEEDIKRLRNQYNHIYQLTYNREQIETDRNVHELDSDFDTNVLKVIKTHASENYKKELEYKDTKIIKEVLEII